MPGRLSYCPLLPAGIAVLNRPLLPACIAVLKLSQAKIWSSSVLKVAATILLIFASSRLHDPSSVLSPCHNNLEFVVRLMLSVAPYTKEIVGTYVLAIARIGTQVAQLISLLVQVKELPR